jgi:predicted nucleic acid-binding protein
LILADTSIWIQHLRSRMSEMEARLRDGQIVMHPFIAAEISLSSLHNRRERLAELDALWQVKVAGLNEVRQMIESHALYSKGIGLTDAHLLASCLLSPGTRLWTRDKSLEQAAQALGVARALSP